MPADVRAELAKLLAQVELNQKHERHLNYRETVYWCRQWRLLAEQFAALLSGPTAPQGEK